MPLSEAAIQLFSSVKQWIEPTLEAVGKRMDGFDARLKAIPAGARGEPGINGKDADPAFVQQLVEKAVANVERIAGPQGEQGPIGLQGPIGQAGNQGAEGAPGRDSDPAMVSQLIKSEVAHAVAQIPKAEDGTPGAKGEAGRDFDPQLMSAEIERQFVSMAAEFVDGLNDD